MYTDFPECSVELLSSSIYVKIPHMLKFAQIGPMKHVCVISRMHDCMKHGPKYLDDFVDSSNQLGMAD